MEWRAFELHPGIPPEGTRIPGSPGEMAARRANFERLAAEAGLDVGERTHWYDSTLAHEAAQWAGDWGAGDVFRRGVFREYFVPNRNIGSKEILVRIAVEIGLDGAELAAALDERRYRERVLAQYEEARSLGITAVPTFVAGRYAVVGAQPYEAFHRLMAAVGQRSRLSRLPRGASDADLGS